MSFRKDNIGIDARFHKKPKIQLTSEQKKVVQTFMKMHGEGIVAMFTFWFMTFGLVCLFPMIIGIPQWMSLTEEKAVFIFGFYILFVLICISIALILVSYELAAFIYHYVLSTAFLGHQGDVK